MITQTKLDKLERELNVLQAKTQARNLALDDCISAIKMAEAAIAENVRPELRGYVTFEYNPHSVAKAYNYTAEGTKMVCTFTRAGTVSKISVKRTYVNHYETVRLNVSVDKFIQDEFGFSRESMGGNGYDKLRLIVLSASGFNHQGTMPL